MTARPVRMLAAAVAGWALAATAHAAALQPYQMVRSLQLVQDRLAEGDHAALPMQRKLLEIVDARLRGAQPAEFEDEKNFRALFIYAMSGGNPETVGALLSRLHLEGQERAIGDGVLSYMAGSFAETRTSLKDIDPLALQPELGAFVALIRGAVLVQENPAGAIRLFEEAKLLAPGTLVEEAALRRSIAAAAAVGATDRFIVASSQYVRRFLHSPYASQFAEAFVSGVVALHDSIDVDQVEEIVSGMDAERAHVIYLRLARQSAIDGYKQLLAFASTRARAHAEAGGLNGDPRALLYSTIAAVTSENVGAVIERLNGIDRARLSANDRKLLDAARAVAARVLAEPEAQVTASAEMPVLPAPPAAATGAEAAANEGVDDKGTGGEDTGDKAAGSVTDTAAFVSATQAQLTAIDRLLKETSNE